MTPLTAALVPTPVRSLVSVDPLSDRRQNLPAIQSSQRLGPAGSSESGLGWTPVSSEYDRNNNLIIAGKMPEGGAWLSKRGADGSRLWDKQWNTFSGSDNIALVDVTSDREGNVYLLGRFSDRLMLGKTMTGEELVLTTQRLPDRDYIVINDPPYNYSRYDTDSFIAKFDKDGNAVWARQFGGFNIVESAGQIVTDRQGNVYFSRTFSNRILEPGQNIIERPSIDLALPISMDLILTKLNTQGQTIWAQTFEGLPLTIPTPPLISDRNIILPYPSYVSAAFDLVIDSQDRLYLAGQLGEIRSKLFQVSADGEVLDAQYIDVATNGYNQVQLAIGGNDRLYVASRKEYNHAYLWGSNGIEFLSLHEEVNRGLLLQQYAIGDEGISRLVWQKMVNYSLQGEFDLAIDRIGDLYLTGIFDDESVDFGKNSAGQSISVSAVSSDQYLNHAYVAKFAANGTVLWAKSFGGAPMVSNHLAIDGNGQISLLGGVLDNNVILAVDIAGNFLYSGQRRFWAGVLPGGGIATFDTTFKGDGFILAINGEQSMEPPKPVYEVLWQNPTTGERELWSFPGNTLEVTVKPWVKETEAGWEFVGRGDFDRDGNSDVFWYNRLSGLSKIEYVLDGAPTKLANVVDIQGNIFRAGDAGDWKVQAIGDFNQDGWLDLFWLNKRSGQTGYWQMNDNQLIGGSMNSPTISDPQEWQVTGVGDYDQDGDLDFYWQNLATGWGGFWEMDRIAFRRAVIPWQFPVALRSPNGPQVRSPQLISGGRDLDGDGYLDLYLYNSQGRINNPIYMKGFELDARLEPAIAFITPENSQIRGVEDFNGDGKMEFLFYNSATGRSVLWERAIPLKAFPELPVRSSGWEILDAGRR
jgi:FG-GAP-like repeat